MSGALNSFQALQSMSSFARTHRSSEPEPLWSDPPPLKWSDLRYVFDIQEDCNGKEAIQA